MVGVVLAVRCSSLPRVVVLRLGHRVARDKRITTHVALAARAFGADEIIISGERDDGLLRTVERVVEKWGGEFKAYYVEDWRKALLDFKEKENGVIIHLTMYGIPVKEKIDEIRKAYKEKSLMIIVGGPKVEPEVFQKADYNIAITNQPHSEVSALAVFLDWLHQGKEMEKQHKNAKLKIIPQEKGKKLLPKKNK